MDTTFNHLHRLATEMIAIRDADPLEGVFDPEFVEFAEELAECILAATPVGFNPKVEL